MFITAPGPALFSELPHDASEDTARLKAFVSRLALCPVSENVCNQYSYDSHGSDVRRENLLLYLRQMLALRPDIMLIGEAPGYKGCRLTGVPFTSEAIAMNGVETHGLFGTARGYRRTGETAAAMKEQTATIMWQAISRLPTPPLLWNAYPFHPFKQANPRSNRRPTLAELRVGAGFLGELLGLFQVREVVAVGNVAEAAAAEINIRCLKIRHPANGGKRAFNEGISRLYLLGTTPS